MSGTDSLVEGYRQFRNGYYQENKQYLQQLATNGQSPRFALVSCCDSRVEPTIILNCDPGDLFVIRNVANLVPPCESNDEGYHGTSAALEFAVNGLNVESVIVLGHAQCGGIKALMDRSTNTKEQSFISNWMRQLSNVKESIYQEKSYENQQQRYQACEEQGIIQSLKNLMTFPWIASKVKAGTLELHGWYYDLNTGKMYELNPDTNTFHKIEL